MTNPETQLTSFFSVYPPEIRALGEALRARLRARLPGLTEVVYVYARQGSLVIAYSPTGHGYDGLCSLAVDADKVLLYLGRGPELDDPAKLLRGRGKAVRYLPIGAASDLDRPEVDALLTAAIALAGVRLDPAASGAVIVKAAEQAKRRAAKGG